LLDGTDPRGFRVGWVHWVIQPSAVARQVDLSGPSQIQNPLKLIKKSTCCATAQGPIAQSTQPTRQLPNPCHPAISHPPPVFVAQSAACVRTHLRPRANATVSAAGKIPQPKTKKRPDSKGAAQRPFGRHRRNRLNKRDDLLPRAGGANRSSAIGIPRR